MTGHQAHKWPGKYFAPAVRKVADNGRARTVTFSARLRTRYGEGMISLRIRAGEDRQAIAKQCATSVEMLERSSRSRLRTSKTTVPSRPRKSGYAPHKSLSPVGDIDLEVA